MDLAAGGRFGIVEADDLIDLHRHLAPTPGGGGKPRLVRQAIEELDRIRNLLPHLRQERRAANPGAQNDTVDSRSQFPLQVLGAFVGDFVGRSENGHFDLDVIELRGLNGLEAEVVTGCGVGVFPYILGQGQARFQPTDAATQQSGFGQGDEGAPGTAENLRLRLKGQSRKRLPVGGVADSLTGQLQQAATLSYVQTGVHGWVGRLTEVVVVALEVDEG